MKIFEKLAAVWVEHPFHKSVPEKNKVSFTCLWHVYIMASSETKAQTFHDDYAAKLQNPNTIFLKAATARAIHRRRRWHCR